MPRRKQQRHLIKQMRGFLFACLFSAGICLKESLVDSSPLSGPNVTTNRQARKLSKHPRYVTPCNSKNHVVIIDNILFCLSDYSKIIVYVLGNPNMLFFFFSVWYLETVINILYNVYLSLRNVYMFTFKKFVYALSVCVPCIIEEH